MISEEMIEKLKEKGIEYTADDNIVITTKDGKFELAEISGEKLLRAQKRGGDEATISVISEMIIRKDGVEEKIGELKIKQYKASTLTKLLLAEKLLVDPDDLNTLL